MWPPIHKGGGAPKAPHPLWRRPKAASIVGDGEAVAVAVAAAYTPYTPYTHYTHYTHYTPYTLIPTEKSKDAQRNFTQNPFVKSPISLFWGRFVTKQFWYNTVYFV